MKCQSNPKPHLIDACENLGAPGSKNPLRFAPRLPRDCGTTCTSSTAPTVPVSVNIARGCAATPPVSRAGVVGSISARTHALTRSTSPAHEPVTSFCLPPHARGPRGLRPADQPRPAQSTRRFKRRNGTACDNSMSIAESAAAPNDCPGRPSRPSSSCSTTPPSTARGAARTGKMIRAARRGCGAHSTRHRPGRGVAHHLMRVLA